MGDDSTPPRRGLRDRSKRVNYREDEQMNMSAAAADDDAQLKAAIEASLRESALAPSSSSSSAANMPSFSSPKSSNSTRKPSSSSHPIQSNGSSSSSSPMPAVKDISSIPVNCSNDSIPIELNGNPGDILTSAHSPVKMEIDSEQLSSIPQPLIPLQGDSSSLPAIPSSSSTFPQISVSASIASLSPKLDVPEVESIPIEPQVEDPPSIPAPAASAKEKKPAAKSAAKKPTASSNKATAASSSSSSSAASSSSSSSTKRKLESKKEEAEDDGAEGMEDEEEQSIPSELPAVPPTSFDPVYCKMLSARFPDRYFQHGDTIQDIDPNDPEHRISLHKSLYHGGAVYSIALDPTGSMLASCSTLGSIRIWDLETFELLKELRDDSETNIEEFFVIRFSPDGRYVAAAGKVKDRKCWDPIDEDNAVMPCPIKIFSLETGAVVARLNGHTEEVLCLKSLFFKNSFYWLSCGFDGRIRKFKMADDFITLQEEKMFKDNTTNIAFSLSILPNCGCKYLLAACEEGIKLFDFETESLVQPFGNPFSSYCDCIKFARTPELKQETGQLYALTRGVENITQEGVLSQPNRVILYKLYLPERKKEPFLMQVSKYFMNEEYFSNSWLMKFAACGKYVAAPSSDGKVFIWDLSLDGEKTVCVLQDHDGQEVRDVMFHPGRRLLFTCGDDSTIKVYRQGGIH